MIEVEIRGQLETDEKFAKLVNFLKANARYLGQQNREIYLLYDYPGYSDDPTTRTADVRLRNTDGSCEIMAKVKASDHNTSRVEYSLKLKDNNLDTAKEVVKILGFTKALKMFRSKDLYEYNGCEWSVVYIAHNLSYFEIEKEIENESEIKFTIEFLENEAKNLGYKTLNPEETKQFIYNLDKKVNEKVNF
jgi:predicted adenylyl cyclase CyaB